MGRRISQAIDQWPQLEPDSMVIRVNWARVACAGLLAATAMIVVTILVTLRLQATSERILQGISGPMAAAEVSVSKADSSSHRQPGGTLEATTDPEIAIERTMKIKRVLSRAEDLLAQGDISAARLSLRRAAAAGNARAALLLGETYERCLHYLGPLRCGEDADRATARTWYKMAADHGSSEALQRLNRLAAE